MEKRNILIEFVDCMFTFLTSMVVIGVGLLLTYLTYDFILNIISKFL